MKTNSGNARSRFEGGGYAIATAADGRTALALLRVLNQLWEFPFDLVILDLMLPQINGLDMPLTPPSRKPSTD